MLKNSQKFNDNKSTTNDYNMKYTYFLLKFDASVVLDLDTIIIV